MGGNRDPWLDRGVVESLSTLARVEKSFLCSLAGNVQSYDKADFSSLNNIPCSYGPC